VHHAAPCCILTRTPSAHCPDQFACPHPTRPEAFGQHPNAEISYLIEDSKVVLDSLLALQPRDDTGGGGGGQKREELVMAIATDLLDQVRRWGRGGRRCPAGVQHVFTPAAVLLPAVMPHST
jgi:hypothetical protein